MRSLLIVLLAVWGSAVLSVSTLPRVPLRPAGRRPWTPQRPGSETLNRLVAHRHQSSHPWQRAWLQRKIYEHIMAEARERLDP